jgi:hypothetical protein
VDPARLNLRGARALLPWTNDGLLRLLIAQAVALGLIMASWYAVSGAPALAAQMNGLEFGIAGLALSGGANGLWLLHGRRTVGLARVATLSSHISPDESRGSSIDRRHIDVALVAVPGSTRYHRAECPMVAGRTLQPLVETDAAAAMVPCELCQP